MTQKKIIYGLIKSEQPIKISTIREKTDMLHDLICKCISELWVAGSIEVTSDGWVTTK